MTTLEKEAKEMIRRYPNLSAREIAAELVRENGRRPLLPVLREWMREVEKERRNAA